MNTHPDIDGLKEFKNSNGPPSRLRRLLLNRWLLAGVTIVIMYALIGFLLTPWIVRRYVNNFASEKLQRKSSVAQVRINPFLFTFEAKNFALKEGDNRPIFSLDRFFVDFELSSLFHWAWTFADIRMEKPSLNVDIQPNGSLNLALLADSFPKSKDDASNTEPNPPRLLMQHVEVVDGSFTFSDRSHPTPATETFAPFNLDLKEISTLPDRKGPYTIKASLPGGGMLSWRGEISLQPVFSKGELSITGFKPATVWKFFQDEVNLAKPSGVVDFSTFYQFDYKNRIPVFVSQHTKLAIKGLVFTEKDKDIPLLNIKAIDCVDMHFDLQSHRLTVPEINVRDGKILASMSKKGVLNWQNLVVRQKSADKPAPVPAVSDSAGKPWYIKTGPVNVKNVALEYTDQSRIAPIAMTIGSFNSVLNASAETGTNTVKAVVDDINIQLSHIALFESDQNSPLFELDTLALENGHIATENREITLKLLKASDGKISLVRTKNGKIRLVELLASANKDTMKQKISGTVVKKQTGEKPWSFHIDQFMLNGFNVALKDRTFAPSIVYDLKDIHTSLKNISSTSKSPIDFDAGLKVAQGGDLQVSGRASQSGDRVSTRIKIKKINLMPLDPALSRFTSLIIKSGNVSALAGVEYHAAKSGLQLSADGSVSVDGFKLNEADTGKHFLQWKTMSADGLKFKMSPPGLKIEKIRLIKPDAKVVIFKNRSINLAEVLKNSDKISTKTVDRPVHTVAPEALKSQALFPVNINSVYIDKGAVDFADYSLVLPFAERVTEFNGSVRGISSDPGSRAFLDFKGKVDKYGLARVKGHLSPFAPKTFTDIFVSFKNVKMTPFSPYSATFAGRKIASGKLDLNLEYKIKNSELLGNNKIILKQFTLGKHVKSPSAVNLPLDLAIALLTDSAGKIDIALPVQGNLDNPKFSYGHVIRQALINVITKIVTAPFRILGKLFGGKDKQFDAITFSPGSADLTPPELEKLKKVSDALKKRPKLKLIVEGRYNPKTDGYAIRTQRVQRSIALDMGIKLAPGEEPGPPVFDNAKTQQSLEKLLKKRGGKTSIDDFAARYEKRTGKKAKRINYAMALAGWKSSDTDFYKAMFKELVNIEPFSENDLKDIAQQRTKAIVKQLITTDGLDITRVTVGDTGPVINSSAKTISIKLKLDAIKSSI